jgi:AraC-like DNA-binding protein
MYRQKDIFYQTFQPSPDLAHLVAYYFVYENSAAAIGQEYALSDGNPGISFALHQPYQFFSGNTKHTIQADAFICGAFTRGILVDKPVTSQKMVGIKFTADGLHYLLKESLSGLGEKQVWHLETVLGRQAIQLADQVREAPDIYGQIAALETYLRHTLQPGKLPDATFRQAIRLIRQAGGKISIEEVAATVSVNYKWLERKFICYTGTTPKEYARLTRFMHTYLDFRNKPLADLMDIAISHGYYDQNHFIKEFKHFTTYTPTQLQQAPVFDLAEVMEVADKVIKPET